MNQVTNWSDTSGHNLEGVRELYQSAVLCRVESADVAAVLDALKNDPQIRYAYPVYRGAAQGNRVFLNDEVNVGSGPIISTVLGAYGLVQVGSLSASIRVFRLTAPKRVNPFKVCNALRAEGGVAWAEPNLSQELRFGPVGTPTPVELTLQTNLFNDAQASAITNGLSLQLNPFFTRVDRAAGNLVIEWAGFGVLQSSDRPNGNWTNLAGATSPYVVPLSGTSGFFRIRGPMSLETVEDSP